MTTEIGSYCTLAMAKGCFLLGLTDAFRVDLEKAPFSQIQIR